MCICKMPFSDTYLNVLDLCRLCLASDDNLIPVFDSCLISDQLPDKINVCLAIQIKTEDQVSQKICNGCLTKINSFYDFRSQTTESQKVLQSWLKSNVENQLAVHLVDITETCTEEKVCEVIQNSETGTVKEITDRLKTELSSSDESDSSETDNDSGSNCDSSDLDTEESGESDNSKEHKSLDTLNTSERVSDNASVENGTPGPSSTNDENEQSSIKGGRIQEPVDNTKTKMSDLQCSECSLEFKTSVLLKNHIKDVHSTYVCHCGAKFMSARYLARHEGRHNAKPSIPCKLCNKKFITTSEMKDHQKSHQLGERLSCHLCDYVSLYKSNLARHLKRHNKEYTLYCDSCNEGFYCKDELNTHQIKKHGATPYVCTICNKSFTSKSYLNEHNKTIHFITTKDFLCETCGKAFKTKTATRRHMKIHLGLKYECHICKKSVNTPYSLKKHIKAHLGEKNVVCHVCGKAFVDNKYMAAHLRSHTGERPYGCLECGKRFTQPTTLKVHLRYHTGERPYLCQLCGIGFVTNSLLTNHIKSHSSHFCLKWP